MRILCVIDNLGSGGAQRQLVVLAKEFHKKGHKIEFLVYHQRDFFKPELERSGIYIHHIIEPNYLFRLFRMRKYIRTGKYDIVLSFLQASNFICEISALPFKRWKLIVGERSANPNISSSIKLRIYRWFHLFADFVVSNSYANLKVVQQVNPILPRTKCKVIYNLVSPSLFSYHENRITNATNSIHIIIGASHRFLKNSNGMIKAILALTLEQRRRLKISWYGDNIVAPFFDSSFPEVMNLIDKNDLGNLVKFHPATKDFINNIKDCDVVALFSFYEGLPNSICEAMALGKPVMVSNVSDMKSLLSHNLNQTFDPADTESIKQTFEYYLNLTPQDFLDIGLSNRRVALELFSQEEIISDYIKLFS